MPNNYTGYKPISSLIKCIICGLDLANCSCNKATITGGVSGSNAYGGITTTSGTTTLFNCQTCGSILGTCICASKIIMPNYSPSVWSSIPGSGLSFDSSKRFPYLKVVSVEEKTRYEHSGFFTAERTNEVDGIYGTLAGIVLPIEFREAFALIRKEDEHKIWQIRSPLVFQIDFQIDANTEESHFFTLVRVQDVEVGAEKMVITDPYFQEVPNPIDLCQLIEIQRVFTKLLRRI